MRSTRARVLPDPAAACTNRVSSRACGDAVAGRLVGRVDRRRGRSARRGRWWRGSSRRRLLGLGELGVRGARPGRGACAPRRGAGRTRRGRRGRTRGTGPTARTSRPGGRGTRRARCRSTIVPSVSVTRATTPSSTGVAAAAEPALLGHEPVLGAHRGVGPARPGPGREGVDDELQLGAPVVGVVGAERRVVAVAAGLVVEHEQRAVGPGVDAVGRAAEAQRPAVGQRDLDRGDVVGDAEPVLGGHGPGAGPRAARRRPRTGSGRPAR